MFPLLFTIIIIIYLGIKNQTPNVNKKNNINKQSLSDIMKNRKIYSVSQFFNLHDSHRMKDFSGCYIIHNLSKNIYYVGQSINVLQRVNNHLSGRGNISVYIDYNSGDKFDVSVIPLKESKFATLNSFERNLISAYDSYNHGYNKTRGNAG